MSPALSIIIPAYNDAEELDQLLDNLSKQSYKDFEILLIDGGSIDHIHEVVKSYRSMISEFLSEKDQGIFDAMNKGIDLARGEWLYFLGCDDRLYDPETLEKVFSTQRNSDILYGKIYNQAQGKAVGEAIHSKSELLQKSLWHQSIFYRKKVFDKIGKYEIKYKIAADTVLNLRAFSDPELKNEFIDRIMSTFSGTGISSEVYDLELQKDRIALYYELFADIDQKLVLEALQHHLYIEIEKGKLSKAMVWFFKIGIATGNWWELTKNSLHYLKRRVLGK